MKLDYNFFEVAGTYAIPAKGKALISEPFLNDSYFKRSIVLLTEYSSEGTIGFVLNKPVNLAVNEVINDFPAINAPISVGGPVNTNSVQYLHTHGDIVPNSIEIVQGIYWGGDFETIKELITIGTIQGNDIKFFLGYSGWVAHQLEEELDRNSWIVTDIDAKTILNTGHSTTWKNVLNNQQENRYKLWSTFPENPLAN